MTSLSKNKYNYGLNSYSLTKNKDINPKSKASNIKSNQQTEIKSNNNYLSNNPKNLALPTNASNNKLVNISVGLNQLEIKEKSSKKNTELTPTNFNSFRTPGLIGVKYKTSKNSRKYNI